MSTIYVYLFSFLVCSAVTLLWPKIELLWSWISCCGLKEKIQSLGGAAIQLIIFALLHLAIWLLSPECSLIPGCNSTRDYLLVPSLNGSTLLINFLFVPKIIYEFFYNKPVSLENEKLDKKLVSIKKQLKEIKLLLRQSLRNEEFSEDVFKSSEQDMSESSDNSFEKKKGYETFPLTH